MILVPFSLLPPRILINLAQHLMGLANALGNLFPFLQLELDRADLKIRKNQYLAMCLTATLFLFFLVGVILTVFFVKIERYFLGAALAFVFSLVIFFIQINYPKVVAGRRIRKLDAELLTALSAITIQINSGVPLFDALAVISTQDLGEVSKEFKEVVKKIHGGVPQIEALETMALQNPSPYFRRAIWQIINGMKQGAPINSVINTVIANLTKEQIIQIEKYGSQLNPLATFYMMGAVIIPVLSITFLLVLSSFINLEAVVIKLLLFGLLGFVIFFQIMFSGIIKSKRPSLLGE